MLSASLPPLRYRTTRLRRGRPCARARSDEERRRGEAEGERRDAATDEFASCIANRHESVPILAIRAGIRRTRRSGARGRRPWSRAACRSRSRRRRRARSRAARCTSRTANGGGVRRSSAHDTRSSGDSTWPRAASRRSNFWFVASCAAKFIRASIAPLENHAGPRSQPATSGGSKSCCPMLISGFSASFDREARPAHLLDRARRRTPPATSSA